MQLVGVPAVVEVEAEEREAVGGLGFVVEGVEGFDEVAGD